MSDPTDLSTLQRKAGTGRAKSEGVGMTPAKAFRLAVSKAAQVELGLAARVQTIKEARLNHAELLETLDADDLLLMLEGPHGGAGVAVIDIEVISALIEVQTLGNVIASPAVKRPPTRTDSAMCEAVLNQILQRFETYLTEGNAAVWATGFRFEKRINSVRLLGLALADVSYRVFHLTLDLADGAKHGVLQIVLPAEGVVADQSGGEAASGWTKALEKNVGASHVEVSAVLHKVQLSLAEVQAMRPDGLINVPKSAISDIFMEGSDGVVVGRARLGQQNGHRALRLNGATSGGRVKVEQLSEMPAPNALVSEPVGELGVMAAAPMPMATDMPAAMPTDLPDGAMASDLPADFPDLPDLPMMPMTDAPLDGLEDMPMAAMPMDIEIS